MSEIKEPEIITGYKIGLGVAARVCERMAAAIEAAANSGHEDQKHPFSHDSAGALRCVAGIVRGEEAHFEAQQIDER